MSTNKETLAAFNVFWAVAEVIQTTGEIPSGELYALLMGKMNLETYQKMLGCLVSANLVKEHNAYYIKEQQYRASVANAPIDAIFENYTPAGRTGTWSTVSQLAPDHPFRAVYERYITRAKERAL